MLINLSQPRKKYFQKWTARDILLQYAQKPRFLPEHLRELGNVVVGTQEGSLDDLLDGKTYHKDNLELVRKIKKLDRESLLILPECYRIPADESRRFTAYRMNSLINLNNFGAPREEPQKVYQAAFEHLNQHKEHYINRLGLGCQWTSEMDGLMRVVMLFNNIKGQELRAFQNLAWYKLAFPNFEDEAQKDKDPRKLRRCQKYNAHLDNPREEGGTLRDYIIKLQLRQKDIIKITSPEKSLIINFEVPSRSNIYSKHLVRVSNVPLLPNRSQRKDTVVWDIYGECPCEETSYRSDRHDRVKEFLFESHLIAALQGLKAKQEYEGKERRIHSLPFIIPSRALVDFVDKLRYRTIMLERNPATSRYRMRTLNDTEIGVLAMKKMVADPFHQNTVSNYHAFRRQVDPVQYLIKFRTEIP